MEMKLEVGKFYRAADGSKVGPVFTYRFNSDYFEIGFGFPRIWHESGRSLDDRYPDLIAEWTDAPNGPVRTVTRTTREIVEGGYGRILVWTDNHGRNLVRMVSGPCDAAELRAAIATLTEIADALEGQA